MDAGDSIKIHAYCFLIVLGFDFTKNLPYEAVLIKRKINAITAKAINKKHILLKNLSDIIQSSYSKYL